MADTAPPLTRKQLRELLLDLDFWTYFYVGEETDPGWDHARTAYKFLPALKIVLIRKPGLIKDWVEKASTKGVCFNNGEKVMSELDAAKAADLKTVLLAISDSMKDREEIPQ